MKGKKMAGGATASSLCSRNAESHGSGARGETSAPRRRKHPSPQPPPRSGEGEPEAREACQGSGCVVLPPPLRFGEGVGGRGFLLMRSGVEGRSRPGADSVPSATQRSEATGSVARYISLGFDTHSRPATYSIVLQRNPVRRNAIWRLDSFAETETRTAINRGSG